MAPERQQPAGGAHEQPESRGLLVSLANRSKRVLSGISSTVRERRGLQAVFAFLAAMGADTALANYPELEALEPQVFSADVNDPVDDSYTPNLWPEQGEGIPRLSWSRALPDWHVLSIGLQPMPGSTFEERLPVVQETPDVEPVEGIVVLPDGTRFKQSAFDGSISRQRPGEPDFTPFITGSSVECIKPGPNGYLYITILGDVYLMPVNHPTSVRDPRAGGVAPPASFNSAEYDECALEIEDAGVVLLDQRLRPMRYLQRRADGGLDGPFDLPWGNGAGNPTFYVNGTGIWLAFMCVGEGPGSIKICRGILPHPDRDRDGVPNGMDVCPDKEDAAVQDGAACADTPEAAARFGFERYVEPGILLAGAADVIPHPAPPPGVENPQQGVFRGIGGIRSTEAGHLIDMRADLPPPPPGFTWGSVSIEIHVRDGEAILMGDPPQVFSPADGPQMIEVGASFQLILEGTDVGAWVRGWTYVPLPREDGGVGDGGGADAGAGDAARDALREGMMDAFYPDAGPDAMSADVASDAVVADAASEAGDGSADVATDSRVVVEAGPDGTSGEGGNPDADDGIENDQDANGEVDSQVAEHDHDAGRPGNGNGGCGKCTVAIPHTPQNIANDAAMLALLALSAVGLERRANRRRKKSS